MRSDDELIGATLMRMPTHNEIESLAKEQRIRSVLAALSERFGPNSFQIIDDWEADLCAVGIAPPQDPKKVAYISTYGLPEGRYTCHIDIWSPLGSGSGYKNLAKREGIDFTALVAVITEHLAIE